MTNFSGEHLNSSACVAGPHGERRESASSKYQAYSEYKDSGVEWFDFAPAHWKIKRISYVALLKSGDAIVSEQIEAEGDYPVFGGNGLRGYTKSFNHEGNYILIGRQGALCGNVNYAKGQFWASEHAVVVHPFVPLSIKWLGETLRAMNLNQYNVSAAQPGLAVANITCLKIPFPSYEEQQKIANFLDHETAKIDTLIEKQQQLIQLLKEKRQAVISHAVTKGLNPDVPMKDSGVEWLGEVPEHWEVCAIGYVSNGVFTGGTPKNESSYSDIESDLNWFGPSDFRDTRLLSESNKYLTLESHKLGDSKLFFRDSVLVIGIGATLGKVGYCNKEFSCNQQINVIYPNQRVSYKYLAIALSMQEAQMKISSNASTIGIMNQEKTKSILIAVPPREEQEQIVLSVELIESKYAKLIELAGNQVELLQERRTALISAAVTGKIDVRNFSAQLT